MPCPICTAFRTHPLRTPRRHFFRCEACGTVFASEASIPDSVSARKRYLLHRNSREDKGYVAFLSDIIERSLAVTGPGVRDVVDWGSGPEPVCSVLLREQGFSVHAWDPVFNDGEEPAPHSCDLALCVEVAEHFVSPRDDFLRLAAKLRPGAFLVLHTAQVPATDADFIAWWYQEDPTHVVFYSEKSLQRLGRYAGLVFVGIQEKRLAIFRKPLPVLVAGGMNLDIQGRSFSSPVAGDSNPGTLRFAPGGAGRNIAENLARLGAAVEFLSVRGIDVAGNECAAKTAKAGVGMTGVSVLEGETSSCYLAILDDRGDMSLALSAMDILEHFDPAAVLRVLGQVEVACAVACFQGGAPQHFSALLMDGNLRPDTIAALIERLPGIPVWFDPVSGTKARRFSEYQQGRLLSRIGALKPNGLELDVFLEALGVPAAVASPVESAAILARAGSSLSESDTSPARTTPRAERTLAALRNLRDFGVREVYVSLGAEGVAWEGASSRGTYAPPAVEAVSATGAGDALMATLAWSRLLGVAPGEAVMLGCAAAALTLGSPDACSPELSFGVLLDHQEETV